MAGVSREVRERIEGLRAEIEALEREAREEIPAQMASAHAVGPVRENADMYLVAGRAHYVQGRLQSLQQRLRTLQALDLSALSRDRAAYGSRLELEDLDGGPRRTVLLVSPEEAGAGAGAEACSLLSPMGRALAGRRPGDEVEVHLVVSMHANQPVSRLAQRAYYEDLLEADVAIHLYLPRFLHAKHITIDGAMALIGFTNMDIRSFALNEEVNLLVYDAAVVAKIRAIQERAMAQSERITWESWARRPPWAKVIQNTARLLDSLL